MPVNTIITPGMKPTNPPNIPMTISLPKKPKPEPVKLTRGSDLWLGTLQQARWDKLRGVMALVHKYQHTRNPHWGDFDELEERLFDTQDPEEAATILGFMEEMLGDEYLSASSRHRFDMFKNGVINALIKHRDTGDASPARRITLRQAQEIANNRRNGTPPVTFIDNTPKPDIIPHQFDTTRKNDLGYAPTKEQVSMSQYIQHEQDQKDYESILASIDSPEWDIEYGPDYFPADNFWIRKPISVETDEDANNLTTRSLVIAKDRGKWQSFIQHEEYDDYYMISDDLGKELDSITLADAVTEAQEHVNDGGLGDASAARGYNRLGSDEQDWADMMHGHGNTPEDAVRNARAISRAWDRLDAAETDKQRTNAENALYDHAIAKTTPKPLRDALLKAIGKKSVKRIESERVSVEPEAVAPHPHAGKPGNRPIKIVGATTVPHKRYPLALSIGNWEGDYDSATDSVYVIDGNHLGGSGARFNGKLNGDKIVWSGEKPRAALARHILEAALFARQIRAKEAGGTKALQDDMEFKYRKVRDAEFWGFPIGTPIKPGMKPLGAAQRGHTPSAATGKKPDKANPKRRIMLPGSTPAAKKPAAKPAKPKKHGNFVKLSDLPHADVRESLPKEKRDAIKTELDALKTEDLQPEKISQALIAKHGKQYSVEIREMVDVRYHQTNGVYYYRDSVGKNEGSADDLQAYATGVPKGQVNTKVRSAKDFTVKGAADELKKIKVDGRATGTGELNDPIDCGNDVKKAHKLLGQGKHVRLNTSLEVSVLMDKLADESEKAKAAGKQTPDYDLCMVSVPDTNLFCMETKGIPRAQMPQFSGQPVEGSYAEAKFDGKESNVVDEFAQLLETMKIKVEEKDVPARDLKATQNQLVGTKVAGMRRAMQAGKIKDKPIYVTRDGYIVDGHHRWAAKMGIDLEDGNLGDVNMPVYMIDAEIGYILDIANGFAEMAGIKAKATGAAAEGVKSLRASIARAFGTPRTACCG